MARDLRKRLTPQEARLWLHLKELKAQGLHFRKQVPIDRFVVDFACLSRRIVVEVDGEQHGQEPGLARDAVRDARLAKLGYRVLRFGNHEVNGQLGMVLDTIFARATEVQSGPVESIASPHPSAASPRPPSPAGEGREPLPASGSVPAPDATAPSRQDPASRPRARLPGSMP